MFGALFFDRDPLRYADLPALFISWVQDWGGFAMFAALPAMKSEFMKYPNVYRSQDSMMKMMPYGMVAILISIAVLAVLYAKIYPAGGGLGSGVCFGWP